LALAIVLVNQATGLINFAQGGMAVLSAYIAYAFTQFGLPLILAIAISVVVSFLIGAVIERFLVRRFEGGDADTAVVVTIGLLTLVTGISAVLWGYNNLAFQSLFPLTSVEILGAVVSVRSLATAVSRTIRPLLPSRASPSAGS
jgi:branched-chain amino acid transport system permease protein